MTTTNIVLRKRVNKDGTRSLIIRVTKNRKASIITIGNIKIADWDEEKKRVKKTHPNSARYNNLIKNKLAEVDDIAIEAETKNPYRTTSKDITQKAKPQSEQPTSFFHQAQAYLDNLLLGGKLNSYNPEKARLKYFKEFRKEKDLAFTDFTVGLLDDFKAHLSGNRKLSERTVANYMMFIQSVFKYAVSHEVIDREITPFGKEKFSIVIPPSTKMGASIEDVAKLELVDGLTPVQDMARDIWLISFYFAGIRISDILRLRWSDIANGRLYYSMGKNLKVGSVKITPKASAIFDKHAHRKNHPDGFIFPDLENVTDLKNINDVKRMISVAGKRYNKALRLYVLPKAGITSKMSMHIARHTFATEAGDKIPLQMLQQLYRHTDIKTTVGYQSNFIHQQADDALEAVLGI